MLCAFSAAAGMVGEALAPNYGWLILTQVFMGVGIGGTLAIISAYIGRLAPEGRTGAVYGLDTVVVSLSSAIGPTLGGWLGDTLSIRAPLYLGGFFMALAGVGTSYLPDKDAMDNPEPDGESE